MEHLVPDLVVPQHRAAAMEAAGQGQLHKAHLEARGPAHLPYLHAPLEEWPDVTIQI